MSCCQIPIAECHKKQKSIIQNWKYSMMRFTQHCNGGRVRTKFGAFRVVASSLRIPLRRRERADACCMGVQNSTFDRECEEFKLTSERGMGGGKLCAVNCNDGADCRWESTEVLCMPFSSCRAIISLPNSCMKMLNYSPGSTSLPLLRNAAEGFARVSACNVRSWAL